MVSRVKLLLSLLFLMALSAVSYSQNNLPSGYVVIANDIATKQLDSKELIQIFKGKYSSWPNNEQVIIVLPSTKNDNADEVAKFIFKSSKDAMMKYWLSLVFQGRANPPVFLEKDKDIIEYIESNPGSISIIKSTNSNQLNKITIKIVD